MKRMSLRRFGRIVARVMHTLPEEFAPFLGNLVVDVEEEPDPEMLRRSGYTEEEIAAGVELFGFFSDAFDPDPILPPEDEDELIQEYPFDFTDQPHRFIVYKGPHERAFPERREFLTEVRKTVIHELAHHFCFTERDLDRFEEIPDPFGGDTEELLGE